MVDHARLAWFASWLAVGAQVTSWTIHPPVTQTTGFNAPSHPSIAPPPALPSAHQQAQHAPVPEARREVPHRHAVLHAHRLRPLHQRARQLVVHVDGQRYVVPLSHPHPSAVHAIAVPPGKLLLRPPPPPAREHTRDLRAQRGGAQQPRQLQRARRRPQERERPVPVAVDDVIRAQRD
jgi:hypothetical protein